MLKVTYIFWPALKVVVSCIGLAVFVSTALAICALSIYCCPGYVGAGDRVIVGLGWVEVGVEPGDVGVLVLLVEGLFCKPAIMNDTKIKIRAPVAIHIPATIKPGFTLRLLS